MIAKKYKLPIQEFIKKKGVVIRTKYFLVRIFPTTLAYSRWGFIIAKKIIPKATKRNILKRLMFRFFQSVKDQLPIRDYLIISLPNIVSVATHDLKKNLKTEILAVLRHD